MKMINLLYSGNYKVFDGLLISVLSMVKHTKEQLNVKFLTMDLRDRDARFLPINQSHADYVNKIIKDVNPKSNFEIIDVTQLFKDNLALSPNANTHFTPYTLLRLLADKIDGMPDKVLYLDTDTILNDDVAKLYNIDLGTHEIAVVKDLYNWADIRRWKVKNYFNAGVILINFAKCKQTGLFARARDIICRKKLMYADQDALNFSHPDKLMLPERFNSKDRYYKEIVVHHFCNVRQKGNWFHRIKPWEVDLVKTKSGVTQYNDILDDYLARKKRSDYPTVEASR